MLPDQFCSFSLLFCPICRACKAPTKRICALLAWLACGHGRPSADPRENPDGRILHFWRKACALIGQSCLRAACLASARTGRGRNQKDVARIKRAIKGVQEKRGDMKLRRQGAGADMLCLQYAYAVLSGPEGSLLCCSRRCSSVCRNRTISETSRGKKSKTKDDSKVTFPCDRMMLTLPAVRGQSPRSQRGRLR